MLRASILGQLFMKRREFIHTALASATLAALPGLGIAKADKFAGETLRLGFIGTGRRVPQRYQLPTTAVPAGVDLLPQPSADSFPLSPLDDSLHQFLVTAQPAPHFGRRQGIDIGGPPEGAPSSRR